MYYYTSLVFEPDFEKLKSALEELDTVCLLGHVNGALTSPIHSPDGTEKSKHIHVIWQSTKARLSKADLEAFKLNGIAVNGFVQKVSNLAKMEAYLTHKNNPDKEQFTESPKAYGEYVTNKYSIAHVYAYIVENNITEYSDLVNSLMADGEEEIVVFLSNKAYAVQSYLMSLREKNKAQATAENNEIYQRDRRRKSASEEILERFY